jgi:hypothetical protein
MRGVNMLNESQKARAIALWKKYVSETQKPVEPSDDMTDDVLDAERLKVIPLIQELISSFTNGSMSLEDFKTENDSLNKRHRLWGFKGMKGQMFFNMLYNVSSTASLGEKLETMLRRTILAPKDITEAKSKIEMLSQFSDSLASHVQNKRQAPRTGSCLFFISFFWQIQDHEKWPVYYNSIVGTLGDESIWSPTGNYPLDYEQFLNINCELKELFSSVSRQQKSLWQVEHVFWHSVDNGEVPDTPPLGESIKVPGYMVGGLPAGIVPSAVEILPLLAKNDPTIAAACERSGISVEKALEERTSILFRMLGYKVELLGQGHGRAPDGIAISAEFHYAIIYDTKARGDGYSLGTDDRAIREYIEQGKDELRKSGVKNTYFAIISGSFRGDFDDVITTLKIETGIREVLFIEAAALLVLLEAKLKNPDLDLGSSGVQRILAKGGTITTKDMAELLGL